jgi:endonuclease YncB( thermonuclease family)
VIVQRVSLAHDLLHPSTQDHSSLWRPRWLNALHGTVNRFTGGAQIRHFVMAITSTRLTTKRWLIVFACLLIGVARADPIDSNRIHVIDGDTIHLGGTTADVRLVGFNAPETTRARCPEERALGQTADSRLREIIRGGGLDFALVACSCRPGTADTALCNYGRKCGTLKARGRNVGDILIAEGLAVPFVCGRYSCPATPRHREAGGPTCLSALTPKAPKLSTRPGRIQNVSGPPQGPVDASGAT